MKFELKNIIYNKLLISLIINIKFNKCWQIIISNSNCKEIIYSNIQT